MLAITYGFKPKTLEKCKKAFDKEIEKYNKKLQKEEEKAAKKAAKKEAKKAAKEAEKVANQTIEKEKEPDANLAITYGFKPKTLAKCKEAFDKEIEKYNKKAAKKEAKKAAKEAEKAAKKEEAKKVAEETQEIKNVQSIIVENDDIKSEKTDEKESESSDSGPSTTAVMVVEEGGNNMLNKLNIIEENISKKTKKKIKKILYKYLENDKEYKIIDMKDGLYKIYSLSKNGDLIENIIDPFGTINGGQHPRICKKAIAPNGDTMIGFFDLSLDSNLSKILLNSEEPFIDYNTGMNIPDNDPYNVTVDFSNTPSLDRLNKDVLLNNLNFALNTMANSGITIPKFRFSDLTDENHFSLISDFKVKLPLQYESVKINGIDTPLSFNKYIDNGRVLSFNNGTIYTGYLHDSSNKVMLYQPPQVQQLQQPQVQEINQTQLFNNIMNNGLGQGFNQYQQPPISQSIITA